MEQDQAICYFCKQPVASRSVPHGDVVISDVVPQVRRLHVMGRAYLHHGCTGQDDPDYWSAANWWACHEPDRPVNADTCFESYCFECGLRWLSRSGEG